MGWDTDKEPIDYLIQRRNYYKKKIGTIKKLINNDHLLAKYGREELDKLVDETLLRAYKQPAAFNKAANDLMTIEYMETSTLNKESFKDK